ARRPTMGQRSHQLTGPARLRTNPPAQTVEAVSRIVAAHSLGPRHRPTPSSRQEQTEVMMTTVSAYAATSADGPLTRTTVTRRDVGPHDVAFDIHFAGLCHSDIRTVRGEWGGIDYPLVPGHEIAGIVTEVGSAVTKFTVGDRVGVGCFVDSCRECDACRDGEEQYCTGGGMV